MDVAVIQLGVGNTASVMFALERLGAKATLTGDPARVKDADRVILPGVGAAAAAAKLLGVLQDDPEHWFRASFGDAAAEIDALVAARVTARTAKNYAESDRLRDELAARGVEVMDSASGSTWRRKG